MASVKCGYECKALKFVGSRWQATPRGMLLSYFGGLGLRGVAVSRKVVVARLNDVRIKQSKPRNAANPQTASRSDAKAHAVFPHAVFPMEKALHAGLQLKHRGNVRSFADRFNDFSDSFHGADLWEEVVDHFGMLGIVLAMCLVFARVPDARAQDLSVNPFEEPWRFSQSETVKSPGLWPAVPEELWKFAAVHPSAPTEQALADGVAKIARKVKRKYDVKLIGERGIGKGLNFYSTDREIAMGRELSRDIESQTKLLQDEVVTEYINRIAQNLARNSDAKVPFTVKVIDNDEVNAFALPGGFMYVNTGLILATESEAELAGVMAHEIAHVAARHATKNATKQDIWNLASIPLIFVGGPAGVAVRNVAQIAVPMSFLKFNRNAEREADLLGLEYQYAAGYDPAAMVGFFEKMKSNEKKKDGFLARSFSTHPMNEDRLKRSQMTIETLLPDREQYLISSSEFEEVKARLQKSLLRNAISVGGRPGGPVLRKSGTKDQ